MSIQHAVPLEVPLTPTSYLVLGLLEREGPSTPYELKRHVAATIGHIWSFPHALLYKEPARLAALGLLSEERELIGRRRRLFTITPAGREALRIWLGRPAQHPTELRDLALLQLFFSDLESTTVTLALADEQLALHQRRLASYEADLIRESPNASPTTERWRGMTGRMALLYEHAAVDFWGQVAADARASSDDAA
jgi:DNA-binding PadR family transcriptional regulator